MTYLDGRYWITFNGEIYNFLEIRDELKSAGFHFKSESDTEVILAAYSRWGSECVFRFNGMWAFAIYDRSERSLFLSRDRFGIKPLFYLQTAGYLAFASELKAFCQLNGFYPEVDSETGAVFLQGGAHVEGSNRTMLRDVRRLQAGHNALVQDGRMSIRRWWNTLDHLLPVPEKLSGQATEFNRLFFDSVRLRMRSDVPIGTCLSGGLDSTAVVCALARLGQTGMDSRQAAQWQRTFIATFPGAQNDERPQAEEVVRYAGVSAHFLEITEGDARSELDKILADFDDVYWGLPTACWSIYREMRRARVVVSLDGHGADELMGGYKTPDFTTFFDAPSFFASPIQNRVRLQQFWRTCSSSSLWTDKMRATATALLRNHPDFELIRSGVRALRGLDPSNPFGLLRKQICPSNDFRLIGAEDLLPGDWGPVNRLLYPMFHSTILPNILRNFDRVSMAHGIEIRMPFMDWRLVCFLFSLPDWSKIGAGETKRVAREAFRGQIPEGIRQSQSKIGFNSPIPEWLNGPLNPWASDLVHSEHCQNHDLINGPRLARFVDRTTERKGWNWQNCGTAWSYLHYLWFERNFIRLNSSSLSGNAAFPSVVPVSLAHSA